MARGPRRPGALHGARLRGPAHRAPRPRELPERHSLARLAPPRHFGRRGPGPRGGVRDALAAVRRARRGRVEEAPAAVERGGQRVAGVGGRAGLPDEVRLRHWALSVDLAEGRRPPRRRARGRVRSEVPRPAPAAAVGPALQRLVENGRDGDLRRQRSRVSHRPLLRAGSPRGASSAKIAAPPRVRRG